MEIDDAIKAIEKKINVGFGSVVPVAFDNEPPIERKDPFLRVSFQTGDTMTNLDSSFERTGGIVFLSAIVPKGRGDLLAWSLARQAARVLAYKTFDGVRLTCASFQNVGVLSDNLEIDSGWFQVNATIPFWFENYPVNH